MAKKQKRWVFSPPKQSASTAPETVKSEVQAKANEFIETVLKPAHVKPPAEDQQLNYIIDIYGKWYRHYFYFCAKYQVPGPNAIRPFFEEKFARLEYAGEDRFNLAYMRHTEQWWELYRDLPLDACLTTIREQPHFLP